MKEEFKVEECYSRDGELIAISISSWDETMLIPPKDFKIKDNILTLSKKPREYFK